MHKVEKQIEINAPSAEVFNLFSRFDHFSRWMKGVKNVEWVAPKRTRWTAEAPDGTRLEWEAEVTELEPGRHLTWHSTGGDVEAEGEARFTPTPQGTTLMQLALGYEQPQWQTEGTSVAAFTENLEERLGEDLIWFRLYAEREAQTIAESVEAVPAVAAVAPPPSSPATEDSSVHFESFSGMLRAGQVIRPARPITGQFAEQAETPAAAPPDGYFSAAAKPSRTPVFAYAIIGLLLAVAIGLFFATRKKENVTDQTIAEPAGSPLVSPTSSPQPEKTVAAVIETAPTPQSATPTPVPEATPLPAATLEARPAEVKSEETAEGGDTDTDTRAAINATVNDWLAATNDKDIDAQMSFYAPTLNRYYLQSNYSRAGVRANKVRRFAQADSVRITMSEPEIRLEQEGRAARVRFRKQYEIASGEGTESGEVLQELVLIRSGDGWRIVSERDLRVLR